MAWTDQSVTLKDGAQLHLRAATPRDARALKGFRLTLHSSADHLNASAAEAHTNYWDIRRTLKQAQNQTSALYAVSWLDGQIVGELQMRASSYARLAHDCRLAVAVLQDYQGRGIGKALMRLGIHWAKSTPPLRRISLSVHATNGAAITLYESLGFVREGVRQGAILPKPGHGGLEAIDEVIMAFHL